MRIARVMLNRGDLMRWSESELVFLIFVGGGVPSSYGYRPQTTWGDVMGLMGAKFIAAHLYQQSCLPTPDLQSG